MLCMVPLLLTNRFFKGCIRCCSAVGRRGRSGVFALLFPIPFHILRVIKSATRMPQPAVMGI